jgi:glucose-6-phosphate dehydrogenase assembly protein OpcA
MAQSMTVRLSRPSSPVSIEDDLAVLWRDAARDGPVARAVMANLVVYCARPAREEVDLDAAIEGVPIDEVALRHPARVIVLNHSGQPNLCAPVGATITILLSGAPGMRVGVEEIAVRSACAEASLPSIVRYLSLGDIPTSIWWADDLSRATPLEALVTMGRQLVYDSRQWRDVRQGILALTKLVAGAHAPDLVDLNWRRLAPMRLALVEASHSLPAPVGSADSHELELRVRHGRGGRALATLVVGWLASRLGWRPQANWPVAIEEASRDDEVLAVSFGADMTATMNGHRVCVDFKGLVPPFSVAVPLEATADAIADELRTFTRHADLREAVVTLGARFGSSASL